MATISKTRPLTGCGRPSGNQLIWAAVFGVSLPVVALILKHWDLPPAARYALVLFSLATGAQYVRAMVRDTRRQMDELQLRIYLEASAVVVCGLFVLMLTYPILVAAHLAGTLDYTIVLVLIVALGVVGYINAWRRYR
jgi:hypothetical protein